METMHIFAIVCGVAMVADIVTGIIQAIANQNFQSSKMRVGLWHKVSFILIIALAFGIEYGERVVELGFNVPLVIPVCSYIIFNEITSILENILLLNPELKGSKIMALFAKKDKAEGKTDEPEDENDA